ncbi:MAG: PKD domain-containing protein, partial [Pseudonocardiales bacterium]|nr:PKD domain-containing protein [Pseudonocardiales bacterium]
MLGVVACGKDAPSSTEPDPTPAKNVGPSAKFSFKCAALSCEFDDSSTDADGQVMAWSWSFGDNLGTSTEKNPSYTFGGPGTYGVSLTAGDDSGATTALTKQVTVSNPVVTSLSCVDGTAPGGFAACKLTLEAPAGYKVVLNQHSCTAHGNVFRITEPVLDTLTRDGCYEPTVNKTILRAGPYPAGT